MLRASATLRTEGLDAYLKKLPGALDDGAVQVAERTRDRWRAAVHVITGSYRASIFVQSHTSSDFAARAAEAKGLNPDAVIVAEPPKPARKGAAAVGSAVSHAVIEELGSVHRPGHPAFTPAVEAARADLKAEIAKRVQP